MMTVEARGSPQGADSKCEPLCPLPFPSSTTRREMGQNTRPHHFPGSLTELGMVARKRPRLGLKCCKLGVQMGTPEQGTPGQPWRTDGNSTGGQTQVSRARTGAGWAVEVAGAPSASRPSFPPSRASAAQVSGGGHTADLGAKCHQPSGALLHL